MMKQDLDVTAMHIQLNELKSAFDNAMNNGEVFENMKKIYIEMKELECRLKVIDWQSDKGRKSGLYSESRHYPLL